MRKKLGDLPVRKAAGSALIALALVVLLPMVAVADTADEIKTLIMQDNAETRKNRSSGSEGISKHGSVEFWSSGGWMQSQ